MTLVITTNLVLRYVSRHYQVRQDEVRTIRPDDDGLFKVELLDGRRYEVTEQQIVADEGMA